MHWRRSLEAAAMYPMGTTRIRHSVAAAASATGRNACAKAVEAAVGGLDGDPGLVLMFPSGDLDPECAAEEAEGAAQGALVSGMTGTGAMAAGGVIEVGCSAIAFPASFAAGVGSADGHDLRRAGHEAVAKALAGIEQAPHGVVLLFVDSETGDQAEVVAGAYAAARGRLPLAGGAAGGRTRARFVGGRAVASGVVAVAVGTSKPVGVGIAHGCMPRGTPSLVTRSDAATILELDGRPAEDVYFEKLGVAGVDITDEEFEALAMVYPLAQPELSGGVRPRYVRGRTPDRGLLCATNIEPNAAVEVCEQTPDSIVSSARAAVEDAVSQLHGRPEASVVFDCAARQASFSGSLAQRELESLLRAFGDEPPSVAGVYTRGEIGRARGAKGDRNHSVVVAAFSAPD
jgi:hypothetical protein